MEWLNRMEKALDYMESNMEEPLNIAQIAKIAYSSPFHFQRMFYMISGMTVAEYVRKRKLTLAAQELAISSSKVIDVAMKYGYKTPESFSKAFRKIHGIPPSEARRSGVSLKAFPRISFQLTISGDRELEYIIDEKDSFMICGKTTTLTCGDEGRTRQDFWGECMRDGTLDEITQDSNRHTILGITCNFDEEFTYMIGKRSEAEHITEHWTSIEIPSATWAVFSCYGTISEAVQKGFHQVYHEWFPATDYQHAGLPEIEMYAQDISKPSGNRTEIWIPVEKK
ncbi:AraC family transcriptional regulator [Fictibacillus phosphorivorans]|uniref:AraC family transcriptional regulator n=1 Tax=Fictibacillus phosphorivorans TaxID=1221500 RepID=A0A160IMK2_9BACL|nr:AraC family transcriptional regulator [Fictibacillus phosphorivorans]ANC77588.1 AraC family transcriptional regulator [Fictibacillus phosphorivorans]